MSAKAVPPPTVSFSSFSSHQHQFDHVKHVKQSGPWYTFLSPFGGSDRLSLSRRPGPLPVFGLGGTIRQARAVRKARNALIDTRIARSSMNCRSRDPDPAFRPALQFTKRENGPGKTQQTQQRSNRGMLLTHCRRRNANGPFHPVDGCCDGYVNVNFICRCCRFIHLSIFLLLLFV